MTGHSNSCPESFYKSKEVCGFGRRLGHSIDKSRSSTPSISMEHVELDLLTSHIGFVISRLL